MEDEGKKYWLSIAAFVLVFIAVVVTLSTFMQQTSNRIVAQANQYVSDATAQSCVLVSSCKIRRGTSRLSPLLPRSRRM